MATREKVDPVRQRYNEEVSRLNRLHMVNSGSLSEELKEAGVKTLMTTRPYNPILHWEAPQEVNDEFCAHLKKTRRRPDYHLWSVMNETGMKTIPLTRAWFKQAVAEGAVIEDQFLALGFPQRFMFLNVWWVPASRSLAVKMTLRDTYEVALFIKELAEGAIHKVLEDAKRK